MRGYLEKGIQTPWREAGPPTHHDDKVDSDQEVVNQELSRSLGGRCGCAALGAAGRGGEGLLKRAFRVEGKRHLEQADHSLEQADHSPKL